MKILLYATVVGTKNNVQTVLLFYLKTKVHKSLTESWVTFVKPSSHTGVTEKQGFSLVVLNWWIASISQKQKDIENLVC